MKLLVCYVKLLENLEIFLKTLLVAYKFHISILKRNIALKLWLKTVAETKRKRKDII